MLERNRIYNMDCLEGLKQLPDKSVNLILIDPPYNIGKAEWDKIDNYVVWMGELFKESERVLKNNGSLYWFHNDMPQISKLMECISQSTNFVYNSFIVWDKGDFRALSWKNPSEENNLRSWFSTCEYCLCYTLQDDYGLNHFLMKHNLLLPIQQYLLDERKKTGMSADEMRDLLSQNTVHYFSLKASHWRMPSEENYKLLQTTGYFSKPYSELLKQYEDIKGKYKKLRYVHNLDKNHKNVWKSNLRNDGKYHPTQKPIDIIERIIKASSHEGDIVLDYFMGSGTTAVACINTNRNFIGFEKDEHYYKIAKQRASQIHM